MKRIAIVLCLTLSQVILIALSHSLSAKVRRSTPTPTPKPKTDLVCRTKQQDLELRDWINGLMNQVHSAQAETAAAKRTNDDTVLQLGMSVKDAVAFIKQCAADQACAKAPLSCWFHRLLWHIFWIVPGLLLVAILLTIFAPGVLRAITSFFGLIWAWIVKLLWPKPPPPTP